MENLTDFTEISVVATSPLLGLGRMLKKKDTDDVNAGEIISIPLHLAEMLIDMKTVRLDNLPKGFDDRSRKLIRADPSVANLHALCPHFYEVGHRLANMVDDEDLEEFLDRVWQHRWENLLPKVAAAEGPHALEMEERLDMEERKLVRMLQASTSLLKPDLSRRKLEFWMSCPNTSQASQPG